MLSYSLSITIFFKIRKPALFIFVSDMLISDMLISDM